MRKIFLAVAVLSASVASAANYTLDTAHSEIGFKVRHLMTKVPGRFTKFSGNFTYEAGKPKTWKVEATIDPASINTDNEKRDKHLRAPDFFDVEKCPKMGFKSTKVSDAKGDSATLVGDLTMHCVTKPVTLQLEIAGVSKDPWGNEHVGMTARGKINRKDWGINWNKALDNGGLFVAEEVEIVIEIDGQAAK